MYRLRPLLATVMLTIVWISASWNTHAIGTPDSDAWRRRFQTIIEMFDNDPLDRPRRAFEIRGPGVSQFVYEGDSERRFAGDRKGSLSVVYDSLAPTSRFMLSFPGVFTQDDDFVFGAILTIRTDGFEPDPFGFHPIAFSLFNANTTGDDRTGDLSDYSADTYDTLELSYFPNVSPLFGGPFLSPDVFGESVGPDAFANFAFASVPFELTPGITHLIEGEHDARTRTLSFRVSLLNPSGRAFLLAGGDALVDLSTVTGFMVDSLGISAYHDGFNIFSQSGRSLLATVDYDLLFSAPRIDGRLPSQLQYLLERLRGGGRIVPIHPDLE